MENAAIIIKKPFKDSLNGVIELGTNTLQSPEEGELLVKLLHVSLDPSNLMWLKLQKGWMKEVKIGDVMMGQCLAVVEKTCSEKFIQGDIVWGLMDWSTRAIVTENQVEKVVRKDYRPLESYITIFSHVGFAAMIGMDEVAQIKAGETVLVSAAAGATGSLACQIAKAKGCNVIGIAGGKEKCEWLMDELQIHAAIDYKNDNVPEVLSNIVPNGPHVYFDNVGGALTDSLLPNLAVNARIAICGQISQYSSEIPGNDYQFKNYFQFFIRRMRVQGYVVPEYLHKKEVINQKLEDLYFKGLITHRPHILNGLENALDGLEMLLSGQNTGKLIVKI